METWYRTGTHDANKFGIEPVSVERSTMSSVTIEGRQHRRMSSYDSYFRTQEEARAHIIWRCTDALASARAAVRRAESDLEQATELWATQAVSP